MLRHEDISVHDEAVLAAGFFQKLEEEVAASSSTEVRLTAIAAAGNEMQIPCAVVAVESLRHPIAVHIGVGTWL